MKKLNKAMSVAVAAAMMVSWAPVEIPQMQ